MHRYTRMGLLASFIVAAGLTALAARASKDEDARHIPPAKATLAQAVLLAEQQVKGRAVRAELEMARQGWVYDVEVIQDTKVFDVKVDADKASVISAEQDHTDGDTEQDEQD
jgi:uncharacterized membrane protein YkoI